MQPGSDALFVYTCAKYGVYDFQQTASPQDASHLKPTHDEESKHSTKDVVSSRHESTRDFITAPSGCDSATNGTVTWVTWDDEHDHLNPKNWSKTAKWTVTLLFSAYSFVALISSSMIAPALDAISRDIGIQNEVETQLVFSAFILASTVAPIIFSPLSEMFGRKVLVQSANTFFLLWTIVCGFAKTKGVMIAGRTLSGFGASVAFGVSVGVTADCWRPEERGKSLAILNFVPLLGPALGPILGGALNQYASWRWIFWCIAILDGALLLISLFALRESYSPIILSRKAAALRKLTGNNSLRAEHDEVLENPLKSLGHNLIRPWKIAFTHRAPALILIFGSVNFGTVYLVLATFASTWTNLYHQSDFAAGLHYIALALGFTLGAQLCSLLMDHIYRSISQSKTPEPETRMYLIIPGVVIVLLGLLLYGWGVHARLHWVVPDLGIAIFAMGCQACITCSGAYLADTYGNFTASASAGSTSVRSLFAFCFPLFAPRMYERLGYGPGNTLLGALCLALGIVVSVIILKTGAAWRRKDTLRM